MHERWYVIKLNGYKYEGEMWSWAIDAQHWKTKKKREWNIQIEREMEKKPSKLIESNECQESGMQAGKYKIQQFKLEKKKNTLLHNQGIFCVQNIR